MISDMELVMYPGYQLAQQLLSQSSRLIDAEDGLDGVFERYLPALQWESSLQYCYGMLSDQVVMRLSETVTRTVPIERIEFLICGQRMHFVF